MFAFKLFSNDERTFESIYFKSDVVVRKLLDSILQLNTGYISLHVHDEATVIMPSELMQQSLEILHKVQPMYKDAFELLSNEQKPCPVMCIKKITDAATLYQSLEHGQQLITINLDVLLMQHKLMPARGKQSREILHAK